MTQNATPADGMLPERLTVTYSPCPNDTFVFHAWVHGLIPGAPAAEVTYADIDITNNLLRSGGTDVMKISYAALPEALEQYELLPSGGALGRGCGPLVLTAPSSSGSPAVPGSSDVPGSPAVPGSSDAPGSPAVPDSPAAPGTPRQSAREALDGATVAVPSLKSTAYLLFQRWSEALGAKPAHIKVLPFREIMPAVRDGQVGAGLVIHEARFTYAGFGLECLADLGDWWEAETGAPIPLGAIVARRSLGAAAIAELGRIVRRSVEAAFADPAASREYVLKHAEEMDPAVAQAHIELYVNEFSVDLGEVGRAAVNRLLGRDLV